VKFKSKHNSIRLLRGIHFESVDRCKLFLLTDGAEAFRLLLSFKFNCIVRCHFGKQMYHTRLEHNACQFHDIGVFVYNLSRKHHIAFFELAVNEGVRGKYLDGRLVFVSTHVFDKVEQQIVEGGD
jgi:hypothetical protein